VTNWISGKLIAEQGRDIASWIDARCADLTTPTLHGEYDDLCAHYCGVTRPEGWTNDDVYTYLMQTYRELKRRGERVKLPWQ